MADWSDDLRNALLHDAREGARALLGAVLVRGDRLARIVETEAYRNADDPGSHAHRRLTPRNAPMFERPGLAYAYFTYGNHWMLNVVAHPKGEGAAVLIRAARPLEGLAAMRPLRPKARRDEDLLSGPGKLAAAFGVTGADNRLDLLDPASPLRLEAGTRSTHVLTGRRIGMAPGKGDLFEWRYVDADALRWVSRPLPGR
ncbi:MAG: DNA-3-methyladenine glycosylase [Fimbriimonadaceae bacterium]|nr:DNA-3-methyladenine glycosylase [Fimbriimonadaceae bacterium]